MNCILFSCLFVVVIGAVFGRPNDQKVCEVGTHWKEDCNSCWCNEDGTFKACTRKACLKSEDMNTTIAPEMKKECEPKSTWKKDCNHCWCNDDGTAAACTLKGCDSSVLQIVPEKPAS